MPKSCSGDGDRENRCNEKGKKSEINVSCFGNGRRNPNIEYRKPSSLCALTRNDCIQLSKTFGLWHPYMQYYPSRCTNRIDSDLLGCSRCSTRFQNWMSIECQLFCLSITNLLYFRSMYVRSRYTSIIVTDVWRLASIHRMETNIINLALIAFSASTISLPNSFSFFQRISQHVKKNKGTECCEQSWKLSRSRPRPRSRPTRLHFWPQLATKSLDNSRTWLQYCLCSLERQHRSPSPPKGLQVFSRDAIFLLRDAR